MSYQKRCQSPTSHNLESGISMIEVATVVLVVGIILAFTIPAVSNSLSAYTLRSAGNHVVERISAVRALAMKKNKDVTFSFNATSHEYGFDFTGPSGDGVPDATDPDDTSVSYYTETLPDLTSAVFPDGNNIQVTFNSRGELPIGSTEKTITVQRYGRSVNVRVNLRGKAWVE
jgi:Tfp pilus assembly protein FimT